MEDEIARAIEFAMEDEIALAIEFAVENEIAIEIEILLMQCVKIGEQGAYI